MDNLIHQFSISGLPKAQPRVRAVVRNGKPGAFTPPSANGWKDSVALSVNTLDPVSGPYSVQLCFRFKRPNSHFTKTFALKSTAPKYHTQKPYVDNLAKGTIDAMVRAGFLSDDKNMVTLHVSKDWSFWDGCDVFIRVPNIS